MMGVRAEPVRITDPDDPRLSAYRDMRERDLVGRTGRFVAEGRVVLNVLFGAGRFEAESVLILESRLAGAGDLLDRVPADVPVYVAAQEVIDRLAGFHVHRGILAVGRRRPDEDIDAVLAALAPDALVVVLVGISNHDNVGSIFRNAAAFEADAVILDQTSCDPLYRKAIRVSVGAALKVPFVRAGEFASIAQALARHGFDGVALSPAGKEDIAVLAPSRRTALFLGSEGDGLPDALLAAMRTVRIDMSAGFDSLNVAAASAIALHRLWRGGSATRSGSAG